MAYVSEGYQSVVVLQSISDATINVILHYDSTVTTEALAITAFGLWDTAYAAVGAGVVKSVAHQHVFSNDAFAIPNDQDAEMGERAIIVTPIEGEPTKSCVINIPFANTDVVYQTATGSGRNQVDVAEPLVQDYIDLFTTTGKLTISDGEKSSGVILRGKRSGT